MDEKRTPQEEEILSLFGDWLRQLRKDSGFTQEEFAAEAAFSRSYYTEIETGKRNVSLLNLVKMADALGISLPDLVGFHSPTHSVPRQLQPDRFLSNDALTQSGLTAEIIYQSIDYTYKMIDSIDQTLISAGTSRISQMVELANFSSMLGNILGAGIERSSKERFVRNGPHKYPDLLARDKEASDVEIKIALEKNKPKGHLAKAGYYLTYRYVLADEIGIYTSGKENRGDVPYIWEVRFGWLDEQHFNLSNTEGDSGKTAVINAGGMAELKIIYCDLECCPYSPSSRTYKEYVELYS
jgi:transcriptional regulator with XRE-family HTH domain